MPPSNRLPWPVLARHGYRAIEFTDGHSNEERCPDVLYQLDAEVTEP